MANRYWVGGTASWDGTAGTKWALTSGGTGGEAVPTSADDVFFDGNSGANTVTIAAGNTGAKSITCTGFTGTLAGSDAITVSGDLTLVAGMTFTYTGNITINATATVITAGKTLQYLQVNGSGITVSLGSAITTTGNIDISAGTFTTNNYTITCGAFQSSNSSARTINLGSSSLTASGGANSINFSNSTNLTLNAGTSTITYSGLNASGFNVGSNPLTFYNVQFTSTGLTSINLSAAHTFNNLSITGRTSSGMINVTTSANLTINGTLSLNSSNTNSTARLHLQSNTIGTARTLTCNVVNAYQDIDFSDITFAGACISGGNITGTRLGDGKNNTAITFASPKTVYYRATATGNWNSSSAWSATSGGAADSSQFPLPQDTAVIPAATYPASGATINFTSGSSYLLPTIDSSLRTTNTVIFDFPSFSSSQRIIGSLIGSTGTTFNSTGGNSQTFIWAGRGTQNLTTAGVTFLQINIQSPGGSVVLQDNLTVDWGGNAISLAQGTFNANNFNVTIKTGGAVSSNGSNTRTIAMGSGTWTLEGSGTVWDTIDPTNLTVTGTATISCSSASTKNFYGGGIQTYPTINNAGAGTLVIYGSNKFADITNTYKSTGSTAVQFQGGTSNTFTAFNLSGEATRVCTLGSTNTTQALLYKNSAWQMGANSTDGGNNYNLQFTAGGGIDYLSVSYIRGVNTSESGASFFMLLD